MFWVVNVVLTQSGIEAEVQEESRLKRGQQQELRAQTGAELDKHRLCSAEIAAKQRALSSRATRMCAELDNQDIILERKHASSQAGGAVRPQDVAGDVARQEGGGLERRVLHPVGEYLRFPYFADANGLYLYFNIARGAWQLGYSFTPEVVDASTEIATEDGELPLGTREWSRLEYRQGGPQTSRTYAWRSGAAVWTKMTLCERSSGTHPPGGDLARTRTRTEQVSEAIHYANYVMSPENRKAIEFIATSAIRTNDADRELAMARLSDPSSLDLIIDYLQSCPLVIHFPIEKPAGNLSSSLMSLFLKDDQYRNQFETGESRFGGSTGRRIGWESSMFGDAYMSAAPSVRPKYGAVNYDRDPLGDKRARDLYGEGHIVLQNVQDRVTFTCGDSAQILNQHRIAKSGGARDRIAFGVWMSRIVAEMTGPGIYKHPPTS